MPSSKNCNWGGLINISSIVSFRPPRHLFLHFFFWHLFVIIVIVWQINKIPKYLKFHGWLVYLVFGWEMRRLSKSLEIRFWMASFLKMRLLYFTLLDAREFWKVSSDSCLTWWLSGAASRLLSLSNCCSCGFFSYFHEVERSLCG